MQTQALETSHSDVPMNIGIDQSNSVGPEASDPIPPGPEGQIEIPFVPAHKRQTLPDPQNHQLKDDTIVVVGQAGARQRKRKRDKAREIISSSQSKSGTQLGGAKTSTSTGDCDREVEEFDYSSVPNLLDNESKRGHARGVHEEDDRRKKKQRHGKGMLMTSSDRHTVRFLRGICFVFTLARYNIYCPPGSSEDEVLSNFLSPLHIPRLRVIEINSRIWALRARQLSGATTRPTRS